MRKNMGVLDRFVRLLIAAAIAYLYFTGAISGAVGVILLVLAAIFVLTSFIAFCPLYSPFKFSTKKRA